MVQMPNNATAGNSLNARIKEVYSASGARSVLAFAKLVGLPEASVRNYVKGSSEPRMNALEAIASATGVNLRWLTEGKGPMRTPQPGEEVANLSGSDDPSAALRDYGFLLIPRYDVHGSAGFGSFVQNESIVDFLAFREDWIRHDLGLAPSELVLIRARGDSMEPTIRDGDMLLVDIAPKHWKEDGIYVLTIEERLMVKRVQFRPGGALEVVSDNKAYVPLLIKAKEADDVRLAGKVVWSGRKF
jgi:phage repressor protein C with HTH and peptisase S24 domain